MGCVPGPAALAHAFKVVEGLIQAENRMQSRQANPYFRWNAGAWFGAIAGSTAWMIVTAGYLIANGQFRVAALPIGCFFVTNLVGLIVWANRERVAPFRALMFILSVIGVTLPIAWITIARGASPQTLAQMNWPTSDIWNVVAILLVPATMACLYFLERRARNAQS